VNQREADALREALGDQVPDILIPEPVPMAPITLDTLSMMLPAKPPPRRTMHCHPSVTVALKLIAPARPVSLPDFMDLGRIGELSGIDVYENDEMEPGAWELREDDKVVDFGVLRSAT
jgi:hypothetical protein